MASARVISGRRSLVKAPLGGASSMNPPGPQSGLRQTYRKTGFSKLFLGLRDGGFAVVKDRRGQDSAGMTFPDAGHKIVQPTDPTARNDWYRDRIRDGPSERQVVAHTRAVTVH